jgi:hypothetical protein
MRWITLLAAVACLCAACTGPDAIGSLTGQGTVSGHVYVESCGAAPGPAACPKQGVASIKLTFSGDPRTVVTVRSDSGGAYSAQLPAGAYAAYAGESGQPLDEETVSVRAGEARHLDFHIRTASVG